MGFCCWLWLSLFILAAVIFLLVLLGDSDLLTMACCLFGKRPGTAFRGKVVWVTGASSGIGEGIVKELAKCEGSSIVISARRENELDRVKSECLAANPNRSEDSILILPFDMTDYAAHEPAFSKVLETYGKLDVLVSNAGRSQRARWHLIDPAVDHQLFELNVFSLVAMNRLVLRHFLKAGHGHLVLTSSIAGKIAAPESGSYTASKWALHGYFESLRNEIRANRGIDITILCPGPVFSGVLLNAFTFKEGEAFGEDHKRTDPRMTAERCGHLSLVAIANRLEESWMALRPIILLTYLAVTFPYSFSKVIQMLSTCCGIDLFAKYRDNRPVIATASQTEPLNVVTVQGQEGEPVTTEEL